MVLACRDAQKIKASVYVRDIAPTPSFSTSVATSARRNAAPSEKAILMHDHETLTFRYRDSRDGLKKIMTLPEQEFFRRFL